jgi:predicted RNA-binding protein YlxR (DUF448 family)
VTACDDEEKKRANRVDKTTRRPAKDAKHARTCVGCGLRDEPAAMARVAVVGGEVVCGVTIGRGAHLHPRAACITKAPRRLPRALRAEVRIDAPELGRRLVVAADRAMVKLFLAARRARALDIGGDSDAALVVVAVDAGAPTVQRLAGPVSAGRAIAWKTKSELGALLGEPAVAFCGIHDVGIAAQLVRLRAATDAGMQVARTIREGAECSRCPEAR